MKEKPMWDVERLRLATDAAGVGLWSWHIETDEIALDERSHALWETDGSGLATFKELSRRIHPEDVDRVGTAFEATQTMIGLYEIDFRIMMQSGQIRWISARGHGADATSVDGITFGVFLDVTERKLAEEVREMHAGEMSHRIKNLFSIASALTSIAARSTATTTEMARDLSQRLGALGRAHDLVRPIPGEEEAKAALIGDLFTVLLAPYDEKGAAGNRVQISAPGVYVGERSATTLALIVHELATNSVKYGALSAISGRVAVSCSTEGHDVVIVWTEHGGPSLTAPANPEGFGSTLVKRSLSGQLDGSIQYDWLAEGAVITLRMNKNRLAR